MGVNDETSRRRGAPLMPGFLERQTVYRLSRPNKQLERRFVQRAEAEQAKIAPSTRGGGGFCRRPDGKLFGALGSLTAASLVVALGVACGSSKPPSNLPPPVYEEPKLPPWEGEAAEEPLDPDALEGEWVEDEEPAAGPAVPEGAAGAPPIPERGSPQAPSTEPSGSGGSGNRDPNPTH